eukprot:TRINITY_DN23343_c0_g2_i1.p1 TRINITY_DN23343_c0_g2~~TRINITY_DN23343_c0_g2_i1.p1  ORF type:complete len:107 (+),score=2.95 TRINITY_DN23343_c0_g2_i1:80-400(+)
MICYHRMLSQFLIERHTNLLRFCQRRTVSVATTKRTSFFYRTFEALACTARKVFLIVFEGFLRLCILAVRGARLCILQQKKPTVFSSKGDYLINEFRNSQSRVVAR